MPGPVSDSYDPEFGTGDNAYRLATAIREIVVQFDDILGPPLTIISVVDGAPGDSRMAHFTERELRLIRFAMNRALETI